MRTWRMVRQAIGASAVACLCGSTTPVSGQAVEPDAPERDHAGCYSVQVDAPFPSRDRLPGREERYQLPDTIHLTLQLQTLGWARGGSGDWRRQGYFLRIEPPLIAPGAVHRYHAWSINDAGLLVTWRPTFPAQGSVDLRLRPQDRDGEWAGVATLTFPEQTEETGVILRPVPCPDSNYWQSQRSRIRKRWTPLPAVDIEIGTPQPLSRPAGDSIARSEGSG